MTDPAAPEAGIDAAKARKPKPGELLVPGDFQLKHWVFGLLCIVTALGLGVAGLDEGWSVIPVILGILFVVEALRLLHRTIRLLDHSLRPGNPTTLIVLLLVPIVKNLVGTWLLPRVAFSLRTAMRNRELDVSGNLVPLGFGAGLCFLASLLTFAGGLSEVMPLVALAIDLAWIGSWIAFTCLLQHEARRLSEHVHRPGADEGVAELFE